MIVSELTSAAQAVAAGEEPRFYDDRGCLARDAATLSAEWHLFVQLDGARGWTPAREAFYAFPEGARTPMGYGVTAFATEAEAKQVDRQSRAHSWDNVVRDLRDR
jgi:copper chaperone NosL